MIDNRTVGKTIATLRQARGMTQQQLAAVMNVSHQAVSKWENGAALPDIQTLVDLTQMFGITIEQLLNGEIPSDDSEDSSAEDHIDPIGSFVSGVINDIGSIFKPDPKPATEESSIETDLKPEDPVKDEKAEEKNIDVQQLLQMAPFMSKGALEEMLRRRRDKLTANEIARLAPFLDSAFLEELIVEDSSEINWDVLRRLAPFLKKEVVDGFARAIALGEKYVRTTTNEAGRTAESVCKTLDDVSQKIGRHMDKAVRKVVRFGENVVSEVTKAIDELTAEPVSADSRRTQLRRSAIERALEDGKWDWIAAHVSELQDDSLKQKVADKALSLGMQDWLVDHLPAFADSANIDSAIADGKWDWLGDHAWEFSPELQQRTALAAMNAQNWTWLSTYSDQLDLSPCAAEIAGAARRAGEYALAIQLARCNVPAEQLEPLIQDAFSSGNYAFIAMLRDLIDESVLYEHCHRLAEAGDWANVRHFAAVLSEAHLESLMEQAIEVGDFDAIDMLDSILNKEPLEVDAQ